MSVPNVRIAAVLQLRDRLVERAFAPMSGVTISGIFLDELTTRALQVLPARTSRDAVFESIRHLAGHSLDAEEMLVTAWRLAGNVQRLQNGIPVPPWAAQVAEEWVPLEVLRGTVFRNHRGKLGHLFHFRVLAGTPCPMRLKMFWSHGLCRVVSRIVGFSAPWHKYPYLSPLEFVRLRLFAKLDPARSTKEPRFWEMQCPPPMVTWNRQILRVRKRVDPCPRGWSHACTTCVLGYVSCPAAVHKLDYMQRLCPHCGELEYFDDDVAAGKCMRCYRRWATCVKTD
jgi:hypothetical protein